MDRRTPQLPGFARCTRRFARLFALAAALVFVAWPAHAEEPTPSAPLFRTTKEYASALDALDDRIRRLPFGDERDRLVAERAALRQRYDEDTQPRSEARAWVGATLGVLGGASIGTGVFFIAEERGSGGGYLKGLQTAVGALCIGGGAGLGLIGVFQIAYGLQREMKVKELPAQSVSLQAGPGSLGVVGTF